MSDSKENLEKLEDPLQELATSDIKVEPTNQCRICLEKEEEMFDMLGVMLEKLDDDPKTVYEVFEKTIGLSASENDGFTRSLCRNCFDRLRESFLLRRQAKESEMRLKQQCRICMTCDSGIVKSFDDVLETVKGKTTFVQELYEEATGLSSSENDGLTRLMCQGCVGRLSEASRLRDQAQKSFQRLKETKTTVEEVTFGKNEISSESESESDREASVFCPSGGDSTDSEVVKKRKRRSSNIRVNKPAKRAIKSKELKDGESSKDAKTFVCEICSKTVSNMFNLNRHMAKHKRELFCCTICAKKFTDEMKFGRHMAFMHENKGPYICHVCSKEFPLPSGLKRHLVSHSKDRAFICDICAKSFNSMSRLNAHLRFHNNERPYVCKICSKAFFVAGGLTSHMRIHSDERPYCCKYCPSTFRSSSALNCHTRIHTKERPYACKYCPKAFNESINLKRHIRTHTDERPFGCDRCPAAFRQEVTLKNHLKTHTNERPYVCEYCSKTFIQLSNYKTHMRVHTNFRPYVCHICNKGFTVSRDCREHVETHSDERKYICEVCKKGFKTARYLRHHKKRCLAKVSEDVAIEPSNGVVQSGNT